jgi:hypothetical protein
MKEVGGESLPPIRLSNSRKTERAGRLLCRNEGARAPFAASYYLQQSHLSQPSLQQA